MTTETTMMASEQPAPKRFFVVGPHFRDATIRCFASRTDREFILTEELAEAEIVVFTGGEDINPRLYGERPLPATSFNDRRDEYELEVFQNIPEGAVKIGICRGAQLLNVLNGGKMWQDVDKHGGTTHRVFTDIKNLFKDGSYVSNSIHHQMMIPHAKGKLIGVAYQAEYKARAGKEMKGSFFLDPEVIWYDETKTFCFQAHPEFGHAETHEAFHTYLKHLGV
jgi:Peptidase C26